MYELRQAFERQLENDLGYDYWHRKSIMAAFDKAVTQEQTRQRRELQRAGILQKAA